MKSTILALLFLLAACDSGDGEGNADPIQEAQDLFVREAQQMPSGIWGQRVLLAGDCVDGTSQDTNDWRSAPIYSFVTIDPACPNPASLVDEIVLPIRTAQSQNGLTRLLLQDATGQTLASTDVGGLAGFWTLRFNADKLGSAGLWRLFVYDGQSDDLVTYGDVRIE